jgi:predicted dinucleotide-binding enzyme
MKTAIIGVGNIGSALARNLINEGEAIIIANRDLDKAEELRVVNIKQCYEL